METDTNLIYTSDEADNWFHKRYYYAGSNARYYTFQLCLNLLNQRTKDPVIVETGCQRQEEDVGAGMSTSIFAEFVHRYGGRVIAIDIIRAHLDRAKQYVQKWSKAKVQFVEADSVYALANLPVLPDLLYLDSLDYPIGSQAGDVVRQEQAQQHCLNEFLAIEDRLPKSTILLIDDNQLPGGGKPKALKSYLLTKGWICLLDSQSSVWIQQ